MGAEQGETQGRWMYRGVNDPPEISHDRLFDLLSDSRRRAILAVLASEPTDVVELADLIDGIQTRSPATTKRDREALRIECRHKHLPKLADAGVIEYDSRSEMIRYHQHPLLEEILDLINHSKET